MAKCVTPPFYQRTFAPPWNFHLRGEAWRNISLEACQDNLPASALCVFLQWLFSSPCNKTSLHPTAASPFCPFKALHVFAAIQARAVSHPQQSQRELPMGTPHTVLLICPVFHCYWVETVIFSTLIILAFGLPVVSTTFFHQLIWCRNSF